ncbi:MAG: Ig-like domain-containing protein [Lachnospiraceae bacterium]|nr:Ig-like domain-containing protein [Lachnospiraceae bacterium]
MKIIRKRLVSLILAILLAIPMTFLCDMDVLATDVISEEEKMSDGYASANKEYSCSDSFKVANNNTLVKVAISTTYEVKGSVSIAYKEAEDNPYLLKFETKSGNVFDAEGEGKPLIYCVKTIVLDKGEYTINIQFDQTTSYNLYMVRCAGISEKKLEVVEGFTSQFEVTDSIAAKIEWRSNNKIIADVDENGVVTGKYPGTTDIVLTGRTEGGAELFSYTCKIKVISNVFKASKLTVSDIKDTGNDIGADVYNMYYNKKGHLVMKLAIANASKKLVKRITNVKFKARDNAGKVIGIYKIKSMDIKVPSGKSKTFTIKIKKKDLKIKKANLVGGSMTGSQFTAVTV